MNINLIETIKGDPWITRANLSKQLGVSVGTVDNRAKEIEQQIKAGRYPDCSIIRDGGIILFNYLVFMDYLQNRKLLLDSNLKKYAEPFQPRKIANSMGWYN